MCERQKHGFDFERKMIKKYGLTDETNYTHKWDAWYGEIPVSIKAKKKGRAVEFGSINRQTRVDQPFILIVGFWKKVKGVKVFEQENVFYMDDKTWRSFFPDPDCLLISREHVFDGISHEHSDDQKWKKRTRELRKAYRQLQLPSRVGYKRDHKSQKRIQVRLPYSFVVKDLQELSLTVPTVFEAA